MNDECPDEEITNQVINLVISKMLKEQAGKDYCNDPCETVRLLCEMKGINYSVSIERGVDGVWWASFIEFTSPPLDDIVLSHKDVELGRAVGLLFIEYKRWKGSRV